MGNMQARMLNENAEKQGRGEKNTVLQFCKRGKKKGKSKTKYRSKISEKKAEAGRNEKM
jgi:hypothetical protein